MKLDILQAMLGKRPIKYFTQLNSRQQIYSLRTAGDWDSAALPGTVLYHSTYSHLKDCPPCSDSTASLFLYLDEKNPESFHWSAYHNVFYVESEEEYTSCLQIIREGLLEDARLEQGHQKVLSLIASNRPLATIADEIAFQYDHYIDIIDNSLNILALSESVMPPSANLLEDHRTRLVKPNVVQYLRLSGSLDQMRSSHEPVLVEDEPRNTYAWTVPIYIGTTLTAGYICFFIRKEEEFSPAAKYHMVRTAELLSLEMQKNQSTSLNKATYFTHLLTNMLQGVPASVSSYEDRFAAFDHQLRRYKRILVLQLNPNMPKTLDINILSGTLQSIITNSVYVVHENHIVFLSSSSQIADFRGNNTMVEEYLKSNQMKLGVSSIFENELSVREHFDQAKSALRLGERFFSQQNLFTYDEVRTLDAVDCLSEVKNLNLLCFPPLMRLMETDQDDARNNLTETLYCYLENGQSAAKTCEKLYLHRNGLYYRLQKIREIMGCDFTDLNVLTQITLTFTILRYLNQLPWES